MNLEQTLYDLGIQKYLEKKAAISKLFGKGKLWHDAAEVGGLGVLAAPSVAGLAGRPFGEKAKDATEVAGLGILAAPSVHNIWKGLRKR